MRTLTVIAKFPQDGLYYLGKISKEGDPVTILFPYNNGIRGSEVEEQIPRSDVVTYAGAAPWPKLEMGDHVLTKVACDGMAHISYFPGKITEVPNAKFKNAYNVKLYTSTTVRKKRRDIIRVNGGQFKRLTEELSQKHHHKPDPPVPPPPLPVQEPVNLNPSKGDEVLTRWQDDGWYYYGIVTNMPKPGSKGVNRQYGVMDSTGQIEKIEEKYIFTDKKRDHIMKEIQEGSCVIAEHPNFPHSFAPGKVSVISRPHTATIEFYDGETKVINLPYIYLSSKLQSAEDINYIRRRNKREKVRVIARDNNTGIYHKGSIIVAENENHLVTIRFDTLAEEIIQSISHVFTNTLLITPANNRQIKHFHYVLAPIEKDPSSYLPAKVEAFDTRKELKLKLCNKSRSVCKPSRCYYISPDYYFNAFQYFHNRKAKQQLEHGKREHNKNRNRTVGRKVRAQSENRKRINETIKQNSPTMSEGGFTARGHRTTSNGNRRGSSRSRQVQFTPQSDQSQLQQQEVMYREGRPNSEQIWSPTSDQVRSESLQSSRDSKTENVTELARSQRRHKAPKSTPRRWASPDSRARNRHSLRLSRKTMALKEHVTYTTTVVKMREDENN